MSIDLTGRVAIVTGAGNGLGASHARTLAARGAAVVVNDIGSSVDGTRDGSSPAEDVVAGIQAAGGRAIVNTDSVATPEGGRAIVQNALEAFGRLDILINNAGNRRNSPIDQVTPEDFEAVLAVHLKGALYVTQPAFAVMKSQQYGRLLFTGSSAGLFGNAGQATYGAAKAGVFGFAQALAIEGAPHGIKSNVLLPMAGTPRALAGMSAQSTKEIGGIEQGQASDVDLVSALAAYLVSEDCVQTHEVFASAGGRYYTAFVATTPGWRSPTGDVPTPDDLAAHLDAIRAREGYTVPDSLGDDVSASLRAAGPAVQPVRTPAEAASAYFDAVHAQDAQAMRELFTEDAALDVPGTRLTGNAAISEFYQNVFTQGSPKPTPGQLITDGNTVAVQIALHFDGRDMKMADFFTVTADGHISELRAYQAV